MVGPRPVTTGPADGRGDRDVVAAGRGEHLVRADEVERGDAGIDHEHDGAAHAVDCDARRRWQQCSIPDDSCHRPNRADRSRIATIRSRPSHLQGSMDLDFSPDEQRFRDECRAWLEANVPRPALPSGDTREGFAAHLEWERTLFDARYAVVSWPAAYGGRDASLWEWLIFEEEYYRAGAPQRVTQNGIFLLAPTIFEFGTEEQRDRILPKMASGEQTWCQGWSEPNAGSDLAGIQSRAVRDDAAGGWRLSGQKTWTTRGAFCTHLFGLFRSDPAAERHRGLTYFLVDLSTPGITVRPVERLDGDEGFAEVFFDDVFVPDADVLGAPDQGWSVAMATTGSERGLTLRSPGRFMATAQRLIDLFHERRDDADPAAARPSRRRVDRRRGVPVADVLDRHPHRPRASPPGAESSLVKLFWSELDVRMHELALDLLSDHAELVDGDVASWMKGYQFALAGPIYAGTNEIQRNVVAERVLGSAASEPMRAGR